MGNNSEIIEKIIEKQEELRNLLGNNGFLFDPESRHYCYLHLLKVRDILGLLTPFGTDYVTRPFFLPPQRNGKKRSGYARLVRVMDMAIKSQILSPLQYGQEYIIIIVVHG